MEHMVPFVQEKNKNRFITMGEIMLRLTPPNYGKIRAAQSFEASYGGSEANIALALANLGVDSTFFSVVPNNSLGKSAIALMMFTALRLFSPRKRKHRPIGWEVIIWKRAMASVPVKSPMTGGTAPLRNMTFPKWIWTRCWKVLAGFISAA